MCQCKTHINITLQLVIIVLLSSCWTTKNIARGGNELIEEDLTKLTVGKQYILLAKTNKKIRLKINKIENNTIYGDAQTIHKYGENQQFEFTKAFNELLDDTIKISEYKFNFPLTLLTIAVPTSILIILINTEPIDSGSL